MKILIVSWYFPPFNTMGALRIGKLAKYLHGQNHDLRVLCCNGLPFDRTLPSEFPEDGIVRTTYLDVNGLPKAVQRLRVRVGRAVGTAVSSASDPSAPASAPASEPDVQNSRGLIRRGLRAARELYQEALNFPDPQIGWLPYGIAAGRKLVRQWQPDIIFASAPPFTTLLIGRYLARRLGIPWVAEYRDRFFEDPYAPPTSLRRHFEGKLEDWWIRGAAGIVTVSEPWANDYAARFALPVETVYNGFDPDEYPLDFPRQPTDPNILRIVYTGILYPERRDPSPLFAAIRMLEGDRSAVRVAFYGADPVTLRAMAERAGVADCIELNERIPYRQSLAVQMSADVLLLLQWNDPRERGNVPGKVFEYVAARRPVLGIGIEDGVPAKLLRERGVGVVLNDPSTIALQLRHWLAEKRERGEIPLTPVEARSGLSRPDQYRKLETFLARAAGRHD